MKYGLKMPNYPQIDLETWCRSFNTPYHKWTEDINIAFAHREKRSKEYCPIVYMVEEYKEIV